MTKQFQLILQTVITYLIYIFKYLNLFSPIIDGNCDYTSIVFLFTVKKLDHSKFLSSDF